MYELQCNNVFFDDAEAWHLVSAWNQCIRSLNSFHFASFTFKHFHLCFCLFSYTFDDGNLSFLYVLMLRVNLFLPGNEKCIWIPAKEQKNQICMEITILFHFLNSTNKKEKFELIKLLFFYCKDKTTVETEILSHREKNQKHWQTAWKWSPHFLCECVCVYRQNSRQWGYTSVNYGQFENL